MDHHPSVDMCKRCLPGLTLLASLELGSSEHYSYGGRVRLHLPYGICRTLCFVGMPKSRIKLVDPDAAQACEQPVWKKQLVDELIMSVPSKHSPQAIAAWEVISHWWGYVSQMHWGSSAWPVVH